MKLRHISLALFAALLVTSIGPLDLCADTIYYTLVDASGIQTVSGTIIDETDDRVKIATADGKTVSIVQDDVVQIIRDDVSDGRRRDADRIREDFPGASALARGESFEDFDADAPVVFHYGFKGGVNISNVRADPQELEDRDSLRGFAFGFWFRGPLWRRVAIQTEALYSRKGDSESAGGITASTHLGYLDVPVLARVGFMEHARFQPSVFAGPSLAVNVSAKSKLVGAGSEVEVDVKDQVSGVDLGFVVGGGLDFMLGGAALGVDLRYSRSLSDVGDGAAGSARNEIIAVMGSIALQ